MNKKSERIEKELYGTVIDLRYAINLSEGYVSDMESELKEARKALARKKRSLKKGIELYNKKYGRDPELPK